MRRAIVHNSLALVFGLLFLVSLVAQAFSGWQQFNDQQVGEHLGTIGLWDYVTSADFAVDVSENWQSEFLQFLLYLLLTVWLLQRGSPESKELDKAGLESDEDQKVGEHATADSPAWAKAAGWRRRLYSNSLAAMVGAIFLASWLVQSIAGWAAYNETRLQQMRDPIDWGAYLLHSDFWARTLQNWPVGVPGRRVVRGHRDLPAPTRFPGEQAGGCRPQFDRRGGLTGRVITGRRRGLGAVSRRAWLPATV